MGAGLIDLLEIRYELLLSLVFRVFRRMLRLWWRLDVRKEPIGPVAPGASAPAPAPAPARNAGDAP